MSIRILALSSALVGGLVVTGCAEPLPVAPTNLTWPAGSVASMHGGGPEYADVSNQGGPGGTAARGRAI